MPASYGVLKRTGRALNTAGRKLTPELHGKASSLAEKTIGKITKPVGRKIGQAKTAVTGQLARIPGVGRLFR
ncbi:MAG: hypothetical protein AB7P76_05040 [Candidatus Melainabacteria bacterium]